MCELLCHAYLPPPGSSLNELHLRLPVLALPPQLAAYAQAGAHANRQQGFEGALFHSKLKLTMSAVQANASACLAEHTCSPLGGWSVWAALPPLPPPGAAHDARPLVLVVAQMDSKDLFHDLIQVGCPSPP